MAPPSSIVRLRKPRSGDIEARFLLGRSTEIVRMYGHVPSRAAEMTREDATRWYDGLNSHACAWVIEADGKLSGEIRLDNINEFDRRARLAVGLFSENQLGRGIGRQAVTLALEHAFGILRLHRVDLRVLAYNKRAIRCYLACGFTREGIERDSARVGDEWHDDWIMSILEHEFRSGLQTPADDG